MVPAAIKASMMQRESNSFCLHAAFCFCAIIDYQARIADDVPFRGLFCALFRIIRALSAVALQVTSFTSVQAGIDCELEGLTSEHLLGNFVKPS